MSVNFTPLMIITLLFCVWYVHVKIVYKHEFINVELCSESDLLNQGYIVKFLGSFPKINILCF